MALDGRAKVILLILAVLISVDVALLLNTPIYTGPTTDRVRSLDKVSVLRIGEVVITDRNGEWVLSSVQYPGGILRGENYTGGDYNPNITVTNDTVSFNIGILITHLNETGKRERELKIIERTFSSHTLEDFKKVERSILVSFDTTGLKTFRYSTDIPKPINCSIKSIELRTPVLAEKNGELTYAWQKTFVATIVVKKGDCEDTSWNPAN